MTPKAKLRAIVFDFDGVILESADVKTEAFVELFAAYGPEIQASVLAHHLANTGISRFKKFEWIHQHVLHTSLSADQSRELGARFSALVLDKVLASPMVPGAHQALEALAPLYPLFIASGTPQDELDLIVGRRELGGFFREVHGTPTDKPTILTGILARHGVAPTETLFIGDGLSDYQAARAVSTEFLARDTPAMHEQWISLGVTLRPDLSDLLALLTSW